MNSLLKHKKRRSFEAQLTRLSLVSSTPLLLLALWTMIYAGISIWLILLTLLIGGILITYASYFIYKKLSFQFRSTNNILDALTQGDYSMRARSDQNGGALDELITSINNLASHLCEQRWESVENQLLLRTVIEHIDVAIIALSDKNQISFLNPVAKKLFLLDQNNSNSELLDQLAFVQSFSGGHQQVVELSLGFQHGPFNVHVEEFRQAGQQHKLLFITDVKTLLRSEERKAWQSLVRVISHEINNSLSPIASISQTLNRLITREGKDIENSKDLIDGLKIITERANGLSQFVNSYKQLAKLPEPKKQNVSIRNLLEKICILFKEQKILVEKNEDAILHIDPVQFEQVLINLIKNAVEAMAKNNPEGVININWHASEPFFKLLICDQGAGVSNADNLFVPFYTTKKHGSGIGLVLSRQVIEAHSGRLSIANQASGVGCCATIEIPYSCSKTHNE